MIQLTIYRSSLQLEDVLGSCFFFFFDWAVLIVMSKGAFWMTVFPNKMVGANEQLVWGGSHQPVEFFCLSPQKL